MSKKRQKPSEKAHSFYMSKDINDTTRWELIDKDTKELTEIADGLTRVLKERLEKKRDSLMKPERLRDFFNNLKSPPLNLTFEYRVVYENMQSKYEALLQEHEKLDSSNNPDKYISYFKKCIEYECVIMPHCANLSLYNMERIRVELRDNLRSWANRKIVRSKFEELDQFFSLYKKCMKMQKIDIMHKLACIKAAGGEGYCDIEKVCHQFNFSLMQEKSSQSIKAFQETIKIFIGRRDDIYILGADNVYRMLSRQLESLRTNEHRAQNSYNII